MLCRDEDSRSIGERRKAPRKTSQELLWLTLALFTVLWPSWNRLL